MRRDVQRLAELACHPLSRRRARPAPPWRTWPTPSAKPCTPMAKPALLRRAEQVPNDCSLILNIGTTTEAIAKALLHHRGLRVITNNLNVAAILSSNPGVRGHRRWRRGARATGASWARRRWTSSASSRVDIALIGISGIEPDGLLRDFDYREGRWRRPSSSTPARSGCCRPQQVQPPGHGAVGHAAPDRLPQFTDARRRPSPSRPAAGGGSGPDHRRGRAVFLTPRAPCFSLHSRKFSYAFRSWLRPFASPGCHSPPCGRGRGQKWVTANSSRPLSPRTSRWPR